MITIGCDPEAFVCKANGDTIPAPLVSSMRGTKINPWPVPSGAVQIDGLAVEFNIEPAKSTEEWRQAIQTVLASLKAICEPFILDFSPVRAFQKEDLKKLSPKDFVLGCDVDFNAWTDKPNPRPRIPKEVRTASGHVHVGITHKELFPSEKAKLVRHLDTCLFLPSRAWDRSNEMRQRFYGKPGTYRPKPYGIEYRVLSPIWLTDPKLIDYIFDQTMWATEKFLSGDCYDGHFNQLIQSSPEAAMNFLEQNGAPKCPANRR